MARSPRCNATHWASTMRWSASRSESKTSMTCGTTCATRSTRFERRSVLRVDPVVVMQAPIKRRGLADPVGFAHLDRQMDALMQRIDPENATTPEWLLREKGASDDGWR